ncbi:MAG: RNA polymerase sigma-70 factor [Gemmatimonadaceae bacterium]|nr:RNA polymerase sigma-70 factor [Gemmatimonadaceae bacterium]
MSSSDPIERSAELFARFRAGDEGAFEAMFRAYAAPLCTFALHITRSRDLAKEVVHDVFLLVWARRERLDVHTNLRAYLYRATRNRALEVARRDTLFKRWLEETAREQTHDITAHLAPTAHEQLEHDEQIAALQAAIDALPERRRMVLLLRWRDGLRNDEVAELLGISVKTVENQITQALRTLRERLFGHDA